MQTKLRGPAIQQLITVCSRVQAFYLARTGRPGPVLIDVPKDVQQQMAVPDWDVPMAIAGYMGRLPQPPTPKDLAPVLQALKEVAPFSALNTAGH